MRIWEVCVCVMTAAVLSVMGGGSTLESADLAWLLVQESPSSQPQQQGAQLSVRRITPKSVFLAPTFTSCSEGYRQDSLGRCVKVVKVNPSAQWDFFLHKLNTMYAPPEPNSKPNPGPFRLPIPLATELPAATTATTTTTSTTTTTTEYTTSTTVTEQPSISTTVLSTTTDEQTTDPPFLIVVANTTDQISTITDQTTSSTTTTNEQNSETTTICNDCETTITVTTPINSVQSSRTTIVFPEDNNRKRNSSPLIRFPETHLQQQQNHQQQQQTPYWWPHNWEPRLWQSSSSSGYYQPRQTVYHGRSREARLGWQH